MSTSIYLALNTANGKMYIGKTRHPVYIRFRGHAYAAKYGCKTHLACAIRKYGAEAFVVMKMATAETNAEACEIEKECIVLFKTNDPVIGYNLTLGGEGVVGLKHSEEHKAWLSKTNIGENNPNFGKTHSAETKAKMREMKIGRKWTPEHCRNIGDASRIRQSGEEFLKYWSAKFSGSKNPMYGRKHSPEAKAKMRDAKIGKKLSPEHCKHLGEAQKKRREDSLSSTASVRQI